MALIKSRLAAWREVLRRLENGKVVTIPNGWWDGTKSRVRFSVDKDDEAWGICDIIANVKDDEKMDRETYDTMIKELNEHIESRTTGSKTDYWFPKDEEGRQARIKIVQSIITELETSTCVNLNR